MDDSLGNPTERPGMRKTLTELEALRDARGYELQVITAKGEQFKCRYRPEDISSMYEAIRNNMREHAERAFCIQIQPLLESEWPAKPMTMAEWAAAGHTLD